MLLYKQETVHWKYIMFANDTNLFYQHKDIDELFRVIISELEKVCDWSHANKLTKWRKDDIYIYIYHKYKKSLYFKKTSNSNKNYFSIKCSQISLRIIRLKILTHITTFSRLKFA